MTAPDLHVVVGAAGVTGRRVVTALLSSGVSVRAVTRSGHGWTVPGPRQPSWAAADAGDLAALTRACAGATTVYHCVMPPLPRWRSDFPIITDALLGAAQRAGARLVYADDTWMYGRTTGPITPETPWRPVSGQGVLRAWLAERMLTAAAAGHLPVSIVRAGELYGVGVRSMIADNVFARVAHGSAAQWFGNPDLPITPTSVDDFAATITAVGLQDDASAAVWHVPHPPASTGRAFVAEVARQAGTRGRLLPIGRAPLRVAGLVWPLAREAAELSYQFHQPFVVDGSATRRRFGLDPTPYRDGIARVLSDLQGRGQATAPAALPPRDQPTGRTPRKRSEHD